MGLFSNMRNIQEINKLLNELEPHINYLTDAHKYPQMADITKVSEECNFSVSLIEEVCRIANSSGISVQMAPYHFLGRKLQLFEIRQVVYTIVNTYNN